MANLFDLRQKPELVQGLLAFGGGILANNTGHYGAFGPAVGRGIQDFGTTYFSALQQKKDNEMRKRQMDMLEKFQGAQIDDISARADQRKQEAERHAQMLRDIEHDRMLISGQTAAPARGGGGTGGFNPASPMVKSMPMTPDVAGAPIPGPAAAPMFDYQQKFPTDFGPGAPTLQAPMQPPEQQMPQVEVNDTVPASADFLKQAEYWKDLAGKAKTKEYRDIYYQNYRNAFDKYADFVKQESQGEQWIPVEGVPGALRKKWTDQYQYNGQTVSGEEINRLFQAGKKAGATKVSQVVDTKEQTEEAKAVGKFQGEQYGDIQKAGFNAQAQLDRLNRLEQLLEGVDTGKLTPTATNIASYAASIGLNIDKNLGNKQAAEALSNEIALQLRNPAGGAGMPGALSDKDREFLASMVPGIEKTPEGRKQILESAKKLAQRQRDVARLAREYRKKNGRMDEGFYEVLEEFSAKNPLFGSTGDQTSGWSIKKLP